MFMIKQCVAECTNMKLLYNLIVIVTRTTTHIRGPDSKKTLVAKQHCPIRLVYF